MVAIAHAPRIEVPDKERLHEGHQNYTWILKIIEYPPLWMKGQYRTSLDQYAYNLTAYNAIQNDMQLKCTIRKART